MASLVEVLQAVIDRDFSGVKGNQNSRVQVMFVHVWVGALVSEVMRTHPRINGMLVATEPRSFPAFGVAAESDADATRAAAIAKYVDRVVEIRAAFKVAVTRFANPPDVVVFCEAAQDDEVAILLSAYPRARVVCPCSDGFELLV